MLGSVDSTAFNFEQGQRARKLFAAVVLAALDDAIADDKKYGNGPDQIARRDSRGIGILRADRVDRTGQKSCTAGRHRRSPRVGIAGDQHRGLGRLD